MGRPSHLRITKPHPNQRFREKIRLLTHRRGPDDDGWAAAFHINGKWTPVNGVTLGTTDFEEARDLAIERYSKAVDGQRVARAYTKADEPKTTEHALEVYAGRAIKKLVAQAAEADAAVKGKGHKFRDLARRIDDLLPRWGGVPIDQINEHDLNAWIEHDFRVEDVEATVAKYGRQPRGERRRIVTKVPAANTLGNLDWALSVVWDEAVADRVVERRRRPVIDKTLGEEGEPRAFIDSAGLKAMAQVMTDAWVASNEAHGADLKRLLRSYIALISATGIRPGMEAKRIRVGDVHFETQRGKPIIVITVLARQGKHPHRRDVVVLESGKEFNVRRLLRELQTWRMSHGATDGDLLFAYPDGRQPIFRDALDTVLRIANAEIDPDTGEKRVAYSLRHYFATKLIEETDLSIPVIAAWLGTSSAMVEAHYNHLILKRQAHRLIGVNPWVNFMGETGRTDPAILAQLRHDEGVR